MTVIERQEFLIERDDPCYPPHHTGDHLEEAFVKFWRKTDKRERQLIPVHWTAVYNHRVKEGLGHGTPNKELRLKLQDYLDSLDKSAKYFVVCTHDDAPAEDLPPDTLVFAAGGNSRKIDVPIPLTCGPHRNIVDQLRTMFCSFVGSTTHPLRNYTLQSLYGKPGIMISAVEWEEKVSQSRVDTFKNITQRSIFSLAPRGYGTTSYRLYEAIQLGSIPVYVSDRHLLPWNDELEWSEFSIIVRPSEIQNLYSYLTSIDPEEIRKMQGRLVDLWEKNFSIESCCQHIMKRVK